MDSSSSFVHDERVVVSVRHQMRVVPFTLWVLALMAAVAGVVVWVLFARELSRAGPVPAANVPQPNAVVWHHKVFQSEYALRIELHKEGRDFATWARNHRAAAELLTVLNRPVSPRR